MRPALICAVLLPALAACAPQVVVKHWPAPGASLRVAVLPFPDAPGAPGSGKLAHTALSARLLAVPAYELVERGALDDVLKEHQLGTSGLVDDTHAVEVGRLLNADAVVVGQITEFKERRLLLFPPASVALSARMVDTRTGVLAWTASQRVGGLKRLLTFVFWPVGIIAAVLSPSADAQVQTVAADICRALPKAAARLPRTAAP